MTVRLRNTLAPFLVPVHCMAHRLNLSAAVLEQQPLIYKLQGLLDMLNR
mgnify:CR=1 FL=1